MSPAPRFTPEASRLGQPFTWSGRDFLRATVPAGDNQGRVLPSLNPWLGVIGS